MYLINKGNFIIAGTVTKDAEFRTVGEKKTHKVSFSVAIGKNEDTTTIFANCVAWGHLADKFANIRKGDTMSGCGVIDSHEYNGKMYKDYKLEYAAYISKDEYVPAAASESKSVDERFTPPAFENVDDDGELPF